MGRFIVAIFALTICAIRSHGAIFPDSGPTTPGLRASFCGGIAWLQLMRRLQLSGRFGRQINCARSRIATVAATPPFTTAATIVPELFRMLLVVRV